jgi:NTP pyrophosphatase (non-canonical NTP hydrolase)
MTFNEQLIHQWAEERGIFEKSDPINQFTKTLEEIGELKEAIKSNNVMEVIDGIGDTIVTLSILAKMYGTTANNCLESAYNEIKHRQGEMVNGIFVRVK